MQDIYHKAFCFLRSSKYEAARRSSLESSSTRIPKDHAWRAKRHYLHQTWYLSFKHFDWRLSVWVASRWVTIENVSCKAHCITQKRIGRPLLKIIHRAILSIVLCIRSALPFDAELFGSVICRATPVRSQNKSTLAYSRPPSVRRTKTRQLYFRSKKVKKCSNFFAASSFVFARKTRQ